MQTMKKKILDRIRRFEPGRAFMAKDFLDIASRGTIDVTLSALIQDHTIRRVRRGLYDIPKVNPDLGGTLSPDIDQAARALARRYRWTIVPEGAWAANILGVSMARTRRFSLDAARSTSNMRVPTSSGMRKACPPLLSRRYATLAKKGWMVLSSSGYGLSCRKLKNTVSSRRRVLAPIGFTRLPRRLPRTLLEQDRATRSVGPRRDLRRNGEPARLARSAR